jgi:hypothetical protein
MRRRPSGSTSDDEDDGSRSDESHASSADASDTSRAHPAPILHTSHSKARRSRRAKAAWDADSPPKVAASEKEVLQLHQSVTAMQRDAMVEANQSGRRRAQLRSPWSFSVLMFLILFAAVAFMLTVWRSFTTRQLDTKGGSMSYMASAFVRFPDFDTEHTPFATKYNLYLYREMGLDEDPRVRIPVLRHN